MKNVKVLQLSCQNCFFFLLQNRHKIRVRIENFSRRGWKCARRWSDDEWKEERYENFNNQLRGRDEARVENQKNVNFLIFPLSGFEFWFFYNFVFSFSSAPFGSKVFHLSRLSDDVVASSVRGEEKHKSSRMFDDSFFMKSFYNLNLIITNERESGRKETTTTTRPAREVMDRWTRRRPLTEPTKRQMESETRELRQKARNMRQKRNRN